MWCRRLHNRQSLIVLGDSTITMAIKKAKFLREAAVENIEQCKKL